MLPKLRETDIVTDMTDRRPETADTIAAWLQSRQHSIEDQFDPLVREACREWRVALADARSGRPTSTLPAAVRLLRAIASTGSLPSE